MPSPESTWFWVGRSPRPRAIFQRHEQLQGYHLHDPGSRSGRPINQAYQSKEFIDPESPRKQVNNMASANQSIPSSETISRITTEEVFDQDGQSDDLGSLIQGKRTCLIFIRHFCTLRLTVLVLR